MTDTEWLPMMMCAPAKPLGGLCRRALIAWLRYQIECENFDRAAVSRADGTCPMRYGAVDTRGPLRVVCQKHASRLYQQTKAALGATPREASDKARRYVDKMSYDEQVRILDSLDREVHAEERTS